MQAMSILVIIALIIPGAPAMGAPRLQPSPGFPTLRSCAEIDENALQDELNTIVQQIYSDTYKRLNLDEIVARHWNALQMDAALNKAVAAGIEDAKRKTNGWEQFASGLWPDTARQLTEIVTDSTFGSTEFNTDISRLTTSIAAEIESELLKPSVESYSAAIYCLQTFLEGRYSKAMAEVFTQRLADTYIDIDPTSLAPSTVDLINSHKLAIGGVGVIVVTSLTKKIVQEFLEEIGERIAKSIANRMAGNLAKRILGGVSGALPIVAWLLGSGMIIYDIMTNLDGALPIIQTALTSPKTRQHIQSQIVAGLEEELQLAVQVPTIARSIADNLYDEWRIVRGKMRKVLDLIEEDEVFRNFALSVNSTQSAVRLVGIVDVFPMDTLQTTLDEAIESGALGKVLDLPDGVVKIVDDTTSLETAAAWGDIAGSRLNDVAKLEIHRHRAPESFDPRHLAFLISLGDKKQVARVLELTNEQIDQFVDLPPSLYRALVTNFGAVQLGWLADQLPTLSEADRNAVLDAIRDDPILLSNALAKGTFCDIILDCPSPPGDMRWLWIVSIVLLLIVATVLTIWLFRRRQRRAVAVVATQFDDPRNHQGDR
jgi:hypothetical protein